MTSKGKILITGASGFVGGHLARRLLHENATVVGTGLSAPHMSADVPSPFEDIGTGDWSFRPSDLSIPGLADDLLQQIRPTHIYHLAGQSSAHKSFQDPSGTLNDNLGACLQILEAMLALPEAERPRLLTVGSAEEYGIPPDSTPLHEDTPLRPGSPYGVSKAAQTLLCQQYVRSHGLDIVLSRPFAHTGPGQSPAFAFPSFARQIVAIEKGESEPVLNVGNLEARRDYLHVQDVISAYLMLMADGAAGEIYNICSGKADTIAAGLESMIAVSGLHIDIQRDPQRYRPLDLPILLGDNTKLTSTTGWRPESDLRTALVELMDWTRENWE
jgi:GDP-4-dehydro-6-deoxy-D-mannose reductase